MMGRCALFRLSDVIVAAVLHQAGPLKTPLVTDKHRRLAGAREVSFHAVQSKTKGATPSQT
jgi:hypothetical protein